MGQDGIVVYIGDSSTDLLCLTQADVGIIIGDKLDSTCHRIGIEVKTGLDSELPYGGTEGKVLWKIQELAEVGRWIERLHSQDPAPTT